MSDDRRADAEWLAALGKLSDAAILRTLESLPEPVQRGLADDWELWALRGQEEPPPGAGTGPGDWRVWLMMAGRGFGKTRAGAEWVSARARADGSLRIALVGATIDDVRKVMVDGDSGLKAVAQTGEEVRWVASQYMARFSSGAQAFAYSGEKPDRLRGPQHHFAWCDELAKWAYPDATWDNLMLGLRLGERPRALVTTTPRPIALLKRIDATERTVRTGGRTADNVHLPEDFRAAVAAMYGGTRLGRQELDGVLIEDVEGALWPRGLIEASRLPLSSPARQQPCPPDRAKGRRAPEGERESFRRVVIGVDPPAGAGEASVCGIVVAGIGDDGVALVLADASVVAASPEGWATAVAEAAERWRADRVIAEANNGGKMVESVLRAARSTLPVRLVHASHGKAARAEPVAALFESGRAKLAGRFPALEDELAGLTIAGGYRGPGRSPDRADAMVWALTELMLGPAARTPRVREF